MLQWGDGCLKGSAPPFIVSQNTYDADLEARVCDRYFTPCWGRPEADTTGRGIRMQASAAITARCACQRRATAQPANEIEPRNCPA